MITTLPDSAELTAAMMAFAYHQRREDGSGLDGVITAIIGGIVDQIRLAHGLQIAGPAGVPQPTGATTIGG